MGVVPGAEGVSHDGTRHDDDGSHLSLIRLNLNTTGLEGHNGANQPLGV